jgi:L-asparaginase II
VNRSATASADALSVDLIRGDVVESKHKISLAMVDVHGRRLLDFGETSKPVYLRSSAKPFQAMPFVEDGHAERLNFTPRQLSILCASHSGTDQHVEVVVEILKKVGLTEDYLRCGIQTPFDRDTAMELMRQGDEPGALRHNCSGKHAGMLSFAYSINADYERYLDRSSKVQQRILGVFAEMVGLPIEEIKVGLDGCSAPNFAVSLPAAALAYARLMDPSELEGPRASACKQIVSAMVSNPEMVAGAGRFDTELMRSVDGRLLSKGGAEGYQAIGIPGGHLVTGAGAGITLKVHDGDHGKRAAGLVMLALLKLLGLLNESALASLSGFGERTLNNFRKLPVGKIRLAEESFARLQEAYEQI